MFFFFEWMFTFRLLMEKLVLSFTVRDMAFTESFSALVSKVSSVSRNFTSVSSGSYSGEMVWLV